MNKGIAIPPLPEGRGFPLKYDDEIKEKGKWSSCMRGNYGVGSGIIYECYWFSDKTGMAKFKLMYGGMNSIDVAEKEEWFWSNISNC